MTGLILHSEIVSFRVLIGQEALILEEQPGGTYRPSRMRGREGKCVRDPFVFTPLCHQNRDKEKKKLKETGSEAVVHQR